MGCCCLLCIILLCCLLQQTIITLKTIFDIRWQNTSLRKKWKRKKTNRRISRVSLTKLNITNLLFTKWIALKTALRNILIYSSLRFLLLNSWHCDSIIEYVWDRLVLITGQCPSLHRSICFSWPAKVNVANPSLN